MSGLAIMMMVIGMVVIWGGLALSIANLFHKKHLYRNGTDVFL
ncbi:methionine/alanine import family NSS transporter small subunit [Bacillus paramycoides]|nr:methionine/alanine import family NSS transporter small subunit [Bacillus paramycoides]MCW9131268.1 methionine/alanine import family NSS transporter small subunit [Bacillus paramycoides]